MSTTIKITPPNGTQKEIVSYGSCRTTLSSSDRAGSFNISIPTFDHTLVDTFPVGSDVQIFQDESVFRGWIVKPPKALDGSLRTLNFEGSTYTSRTQKIIVTESYTDIAISDIVIDLFTKYVPWVTLNNVESCDKTIATRFADSYLWDALDQLCQISSYDWYIDENLDVNFFNPSERINPIVLSLNNINFKKGTSSFTPDASKLVNKLWIKGGKTISQPYIQSITVGVNPIPLFYTVKALVGTDVTVVIDGVPKTVGIQNLDENGTKDFLLNTTEKLLVPDLCISGTGTITYKYEYPIKILIENLDSQAKYGLFEDIYKVDTGDKILAKEMGMQYLAKYSTPVTTGKIEPIGGIYKAGELIKIEIPYLNIDEYMQIKEVNCESDISGIINRTLQLSSKQRDAVSILKDMSKRLAQLEKTVFNDEDGLVEKYVFFNDTIPVPEFVDDGLTWFLHQYLLCGENLVCSETLII